VIKTKAQQSIAKEKEINKTYVLEWSRAI